MFTMAFVSASYVYVRVNLIVSSTTLIKKEAYKCLYLHSLLKSPVVLACFL